MIKNVSDKAQSLGLIPELQESRLEVTTEKGEPVPLTRYGQRFYHGFHLSSGSGPLDFAPSEEIKTPMVLTRIYDMSELGTYLVKVKQRISRTDDKNFVDATSNVLRITVR